MPVAAALVHADEGGNTIRKAGDSLAQAYRAVKTSLLLLRWLAILEPCM
jgi:hypothetical protein